MPPPLMPLVPALVPVPLLPVELLSRPLVVPVELLPSPLVVPVVPLVLPVPASDEDEFGLLEPVPAVPLPVVPLVLPLIEELAPVPPRTPLEVALPGAVLVDPLIPEAVEPLMPGVVVTEPLMPGVAVVEPVMPAPAPIDPVVEPVVPAPAVPAPENPTQSGVWRYWPVTGS